MASFAKGHRWVGKASHSTMNSFREKVKLESTQATLSRSPIMKRNHGKCSAGKRRHAIGRLCWWHVQVGAGQAASPPTFRKQVADIYSQFRYTQQTYPRSVSDLSQIRDQTGPGLKFITNQMDHFQGKVSTFLLILSWLALKLWCMACACFWMLTWLPLASYWYDQIVPND